MGNSKKTRVINTTTRVMKIKVCRGLPMDGDDYVIKADKQTDIDGTKYDGEDYHGGQLSIVMILRDGKALLDSKSSRDLVLRGEDFFSYKTVTISQRPGQKSIYQVTFEPRNASGAAKTRYTKSDLVQHEVFSDSILNNDNGWSVQHCKDGVLKLTRKEGMTKTLDPSKLFASNIVPDPETPLLNVFLKFWPSTFADLNCKDDLGTTIDIVNFLMRQARECPGDKSKVKVDRVVQKVHDLHKLCPDMVDWCRSLFQEEMKDRFPKVGETMAKVDPEKLKMFESTIEHMLKNS